MPKYYSVKIDVSKIDKKRLYKGKKGNYLNGILVINDKADQFDQIGFVVESITKEEKAKGKKGTIIGNIKDFGAKKAQSDPGDDLPF